MTVCNMSIEGGARCGYVNPDETTFAYLRGRRVRAAGRRLRARGRLVARHGERRRRPTTPTASSSTAREIAPDRHLGHQPRPERRRRRAPPDARRRRRTTSAPRSRRRYALHGPARPASRSRAPAIDVAFIGSCTNGRISDLREAARVARTGTGRAGRARAAWCRARRRWRAQAEAEGLHEIFRAAGFEWREPGCSMCLAMNPDKLRRPRAVRLVQQPQLQGPPGLADRAHAADVAGHGGGRRDRGQRRDVRELL